MNTQIIAIANQKGGVGKTTTCANLGIGLAQAGKKVLLIDGDPQGSLTISLGHPQPDKLPFTLSDAMGRILMDEPLRPGEGILHHPEGVDLMPADIQLSGMEVSLVNAMSRETILRQYLDTLKGQYSHILIDCQPSLGMLTVNALAAANRIIIPVQAEYLPAKGLEQLLSTVNKVKRQINPKLQIDGILLTMVDSRTNFAKEISALLRETYGSKIKVFGTEIPHSVRAKEISAEGKSIFAHDPSGKVAVAENGSQDFTVIANSGYSISSVTVDGGAIVERKAEGTYTVKNVTKNCTVTATFSKNSSSGGSSSSSTRYTVSVEDTDNGSVKVSPTRASKGSTVTVTVKPDEGYELDKLTVTGKDGDSIKLTDKGDGKYTFKMPASKVEVEAVFTAIETEPEQPESLPFTDVSSGEWYYDAVAYVYEKGLMDGTSAVTFDPGAVLTRAMTAQGLWNLAGSPAAPGGAGFTDVAADAWYAGAVNWAAARGIVKGYDTGAFGPEDSVTREQLAAILYRYAQAKGYDTTQGGMAVREFSDSASISDWAQEAMAWAVNAQVLSGKGNGVLDPQGTATRAEVAQMLMNFGEHVG